MGGVAEQTEMGASKKNNKKTEESNKVISRTSNFKQVFHLDNGKSPFGKQKKSTEDASYIRNSYGM